MISVITLGRQPALTTFRRYYLLKNKLSDRMMKQLLNSVIAKYRDLSVASRSIICRSRRLRQIIDLLATDKSRYFAQPHPIIANYYCWFACDVIKIKFQTKNYHEENNVFLFSDTGGSEEGVLSLMSLQGTPTWTLSTKHHFSK